MRYGAESYVVERARERDRALAQCNANRRLSGNELNAEPSAP